MQASTAHSALPCLMTSRGGAGGQVSCVPNVWQALVEMKEIGEGLIEDIVLYEH